MNGSVLFGDDIPARLGLPGSPPDFRLEQVGFRGALGCPNELLLLLRKVAAEILCGFRTQPDTAVDDFNVGKNVGLREVGLLRLSRFIGVRRERGDVNQPDNTIVSSGAGDNTSAVRVADENNRTADPAYGFFRHGNVLCRCVEGVLRRNAFIPLRLKGNDQLAEARAIGPEPMAEHDTWFCGHIYIFLLVRFFVSRFQLGKSPSNIGSPLVELRPQGLVLNYMPVLLLSDCP